MHKVLFDTRSKVNANALRGVGVYTRLLLSHMLPLAASYDIELIDSSNQLSSFKPDLVHYPFFDFFFPTLALFPTTKTIVTIHDVIPLVFKEHYPAGVKGTISLQRQKIAVRKAAAIITDSYASKDDIVKYLGIPDQKINVVYLAGNPEIKVLPDKLRQKILKTYKIPKNYILYVGDINFNKNIPQLIKCIKYLPKQVHLVLVGKNFRPQEIVEWQWIESQLAMSQVGNRVHFVTDLGSNASHELSALYAGAIAYVQPSLYEGFGLPVLEAMSVRTPVICSQNSSLIEVAKGNAIFVSPQAEAIAEAVNQVIEWSGAERRRITAAALTWAQQFSWTKTAEQTLATYQSVLNS